MEPSVALLGDYGIRIVIVLCLALLLLFIALQRRPPAGLDRDAGLAGTVIVTGSAVTAVVAGAVDDEAGRLALAALGIGGAYALFASLARRWPDSAHNMHVGRSSAEFLLGGIAFVHVSAGYFELASAASTSVLPRPFWTAVYIALLVAAALAVLPNHLHQVGGQGTVLGIGLCAYGGLQLLLFAMDRGRMRMLDLPGSDWVWTLAVAALVLVGCVAAPRIVTAAGALLVLLSPVALEAVAGSTFTPEAVALAVALAMFGVGFAAVSTAAGRTLSRAGVLR
ncbi:hypothetical protein [Arthrobacter mangrovi]|uniref:Uncharacterized protein n=1 Tax=Arthrobacter mangrovi TaxID=2966350 RepID=A0ABQ5MW11_9MICC|nr:hypothetical protein [Arthrobacter mangrovi]GLB68169.1 hypothetical protein AHIS1636_26110 [Arthrobacter mangrovi]